MQKVQSVLVLFYFSSMCTQFSALDFQLEYLTYRTLSYAFNIFVKNFCFIEFHFLVDFENYFLIIKVQACFPVFPITSAQLRVFIKTYIVRYACKIFVQCVNQTRNIRKRLLFTLVKLVYSFSYRTSE